MLSTSQRAPGYRFQYQVPPTSPPCSKTRAVKPLSTQPVQHVHAGKPGTDHDDVVRLGGRRLAFGRTWIARLTSFRAPLEIFLLLRTSILPAAPKRKAQIGHTGLHILPVGECGDCCTAIPGVSTQDQARGNRLGFATPMR